MKKQIKLEYDNHIKDIYDLINQLKSLQQDALAQIKCPCNLGEEVFVKDYYALGIVIRYLKEVEKCDT